MCDFYEIGVIDNELFLDANPDQKREMVNVGAQIVESFSRLGTSFEPIVVKRLRHDMRELERLHAQQGHELASVYEMVNSMQTHEMTYDTRMDAVNAQVCAYDRHVATLQARVDCMEAELTQLRRSHLHTSSCKKLWQMFGHRRRRNYSIAKQQTNKRTKEQKQQKQQSLSEDEDPHHWLVDSREK